MISAIFPAAGCGKRTGLPFNKIFADFLGQPLFIHTLRRFSSFAQIDELVIAAAPKEVKLIESLLEKYDGLLPYKVVAGGATRQQSVYNGLMATSKGAQLVLVHDMARPFVTKEVVERVIKGAQKNGAAIAAIAATDTIKQTDENNLVLNTPPRAALKAVQTPQGFQKALLLKAYEMAKNDGFEGTDDASLLEHCKMPVWTVAGDPCNIKITSPTDLLFAKALFAQQKND